MIKNAATNQSDGTPVRIAPGASIRDEETNEEELNLTPRDVLARDYDHRWYFAGDQYNSPRHRNNWYSTPKSYGRPLGQPDGDEDGDDGDERSEQ